MSLADLPEELVDIVAGFLGLEGTWRALDEVVRDHAALATAGRGTRPLADRLADQIRRHLKVAEGAPVVHIQRPVVPAPLRPDVDERSDMKHVRAAAEECGVKCARSKAETLGRIRGAIEANAATIVRRTARQRAWDAGERPDPVPRNPVPVHMRARALEPQRLTASGARARFALTDRDLDGLTALTKRNPYSGRAPPMRLYRVSDLREAADEKYGGISRVGEQKKLRQERAERASKAAAESRSKRRDALLTALEVRGCELRDDSRLCAAFVNTGRGDVEIVADTMAEMKFVHEHTRYRDIVDEIVDEAREFGVRYDIHDVSREARARAVEEFVARGADMHLVPIHLR